MSRPVIIVLSKLARKKFEKNYSVRRSCRLHHEIAMNRWYLDRLEHQISCLYIQYSMNFEFVLRRVLPIALTRTTLKKRRQRKRKKWLCLKSTAVVGKIRTIKKRIMYKSNNITNLLQEIVEYLLPMFIYSHVSNSFENRQFRLRQSLVQLTSH